MPLLPADAIKQGLLHPDVDVRFAALRYFAYSHDPDLSVMPVVIDALNLYGRSRAFQFLSPISTLSQTEATVSWAVAEITARPAHAEEEPDYRRMIARLLCQANPRFVGPHEAALSVAPTFGPQHRVWLARRVRYSSEDGDALWRELEAVCEAGMEEPLFGNVRWTEGLDLVDALARQGARHAARAMDLLALKIESYAGNPMSWLEPLAVRLVGLLRHEPAVPLVVPKLYEEGEELSDECMSALVRIGTDSAVRAVRDAYPAAESHFRLYATGVLAGVHTDAAVQACTELLATETDLDLQNELAQALVEHFSTEGNEVARTVLLNDPDLVSLRDMLVASCGLTGQAFPELEGWRQEAREESLRPRFLFGGPAAPHPAARGPAAPRPAAPVPAMLSVPQPVRRVEERVGRNDPCPCGSGKKFKKCCMPKGSRSS